MIIRCGDKLWHCHRAVLSHRSSYFAAAFGGRYAVPIFLRTNGVVDGRRQGLTTYTQESMTNEIELKEDHHVAITYLLMYLYSKSLDDLCKCHTLAIFVVADKYVVEPLRAGCLLYLQRLLANIEIPEPNSDEIKLQNSDILTGIRLWELEQEGLEELRTEFLCMVVRKNRHLDRKEEMGRLLQTFPGLERLG